MTTTNFQEYEAFREKQMFVLDALDSSAALFDQLEVTAAAESVRRLGRRVRHESFKVLVLGEFKRGKSTFINALLGEEVLPAYSMPCTAVINEIKWGEERRAVLHIRNGLADDALQRIPEGVRSRMQTDDAGRWEPVEVPIEELEAFVVIPDPARDHAASVAESPYERVEIFWTIDLCKNGVVLIDSPGLNEHRTRASITTDYLQSSDAVIFVMSCHALGGKSEMRVLDEDVRGSGHEQVFIVCNRFDEVGEHDRQRVVDYARSKLAPRTAFGESGVYFISSLDAMEGRCDGNAERLRRSGLLELESDLARFLVEDRGKVKLMQPVRGLSAEIGRALSDTIPSQSRMLDQSLGDLEEKYGRIKPRLDDAEGRRKAIMESISRSRARMRDDVRRELRQRLRDLSLHIPSWLRTYEPNNAIQFISLESAKMQAASVIKECNQHVEWMLEVEQANWQRGHFQPFLEQRLQEMGEDIRTPLDGLLGELDAMKAELTEDDARLITKHDEIHPLERMLSAAGGFVVGGVGSALLGGMLGYKEMLKSLIPAFGVTLGLMLVGLTNPLVFVGALLGAGALQGVLSTKSATRKVVEATGDALAQKLRERSDEMADGMAQAVHERTEDMSRTIDSGMEKEIQGLREQIETVLEEKRQGEATVAARKDELVRIAQELGEVQEQLSGLVFS